LYRNHHAIVELLLRKGALVDGPKNAKCSPLLRAAAAGALEACELLVAYGADVNFIDCSFNDGQTPLLKAVARGHEQVASLLITSGAMLDAKDSSGSCVWQLSRDYPSLRILLLTLGVDGGDDVEPPCDSESSGHQATEARTVDTPNIECPSNDADESKSSLKDTATTSIPQLEQQPVKEAQPEPSTPQTARANSEFGIACPLCKKMIMVAQRTPCCRRLVCGGCNRATRNMETCGLC
jgi:hypothetical protein